MTNSWHLKENEEKANWRLVIARNDTNYMNPSWFSRNTELLGDTEISKQGSSVGTGLAHETVEAKKPLGLPNGDPGKVVVEFGPWDHRGSGVNLGGQIPRTEVQLKV